MPLSAARVLLHPPKRYVLGFDGEDDYVKVYPFEVYGWQAFTLERLIWVPSSKPNTDWSKSCMLGDRGAGARAAIHHGYKNQNEIDGIYITFITRKPDDSPHLYETFQTITTESWHYIVQRFRLSDRLYQALLDGQIVREDTIPSDETTILETNPDDTPYPDHYRTFTIGANVTGGERSKEKVAYVRWYNVWLDDQQIQHNLNDPMNPITDGLVLWLNGHRLENNVVPDFSGNDNDGAAYGGVSQGYEVYPEYANSMLLEFKPKVIA